MTAQDIAVSQAMRFYGDTLSTDEGRIACVRKFGYHVWELAKGNWEYMKVEHTPMEERIKEFERFLDSLDGVATQHTQLK